MCAKQKEGHFANARWQKRQLQVHEIIMKRQCFLSFETLDLQFYSFSPVSPYFIALGF